MKTRKCRLVALLIGAVVVIPFMIAVTALLKWLSLLAWAAVLWTAWDYYRSGEMVSAVESAAREGSFLTGAWEDDVE